MRASEAVNGLTGLVDRYERVVMYGDYDETVWMDDRVRREQRDAIDSLRA